MKNTDGKIHNKMGTFCKTCECVNFRAQNLMWPIFLVDKPNDRQEIDSMPGVSRMGVDTMMQELEKLAPLGLKSVLLFSVTDLPKVSIF